MAKSKPKAKAAKAPAKPMTKSALFTELAEQTELKKTDIAAVFATLEAIMSDQLKKTGKFTIPNIARLSLKRVAAVKGGEKKMNPLTKTEYVTKPKPAHNKISIRIVKTLKDNVN